MKLDPLPLDGCPDHGFTNMQEVGITYTLREVEVNEDQPDVLRSTYIGTTTDVDEFHCYTCNTCWREWTWSDTFETHYE